MREVLRAGDIEGVGTVMVRCALCALPCPFPRLAIKTGGAQIARMRLWMKVVECAKAGDEGGKGSGNIGIADVCVMVFAVDAVVMDFGMEGMRQLARGAAEIHEEPSGGYIVDGETMLREPAGHFRDVAARRPKVRAELLGRKPAMKVRRARVVLPADELLECLLPRARCAATS